MKISDDKLTEMILDITRRANVSESEVLREAAARILKQSARLSQFRKERDILKEMINGLRYGTGYAKDFICPICAHLNENMGKDLSPCMDCLREPMHPGFRLAAADSGNINWCGEEQILETKPEGKVTTHADTV